MNPIAKLNMITELIDSGMLCNCGKIKFEENIDGTYDRILVHDKECKASKKAFELLNKAFELLNKEDIK